MKSMTHMYSQVPNITEGVKIPTKKIAKQMLKKLQKQFPEVKEWSLYIDGQLTKLK